MGSTYVALGVLCLMRWIAISEAVVMSHMFYSNSGCFADIPSNEQIVSSNSKCAFLCASHNECRDYNYVKTTSLCQIFYYTPKSHAEVDNCKSYSSMRLLPKDAAVVGQSGEDVLLTCRSLSALIRWIFTPVESSTPVSIVEECSVVETFSGQYLTEKTDLGCNLLIENVTMNQSGTYVCEDEHSEVHSVSQVLVFESEPVCAINGSIMVDGDWLEVKCEAIVSRNGELSMTCLDFYGAPIGLPGVASDTMRSYYIQGSPPTLQSFICTVSVNTVPVNTTQGRIDATYRPDYSYKWMSPTIKVVCHAGFDFIDEANGCYRPILELLDWATARVRCQQLYSEAYSVVITSAAEQNAIASYLGSELNDTCYYDSPWPNTYDGFFVWTGAQRSTLSSSSFFVWKPNNSTTLAMNYTSWMSGQPDSQFGKDEFCMDLLQSGSYKWNDEDCTWKTCVLCEYGPF